MQSSRFTRLFLLLAAFAACVQWAIPHGWMVGSADEGHTVLVPCPSTSPQLASLGKTFPASSEHDHHASMHAADHGGMDDAGGKADDHGAAQAKCDFAAMGAPVLPPDAPALAAPPSAATDLFTKLPNAFPGRGLAAPPPPATGPPVTRA
jgi:hypothetical protein